MYLHDVRRTCKLRAAYCLQEVARERAVVQRLDKISKNVPIEIWLKFNFRKTICRFRYKANAYFKLSRMEKSAREGEETFMKWPTVRVHRE